MTSPPSKPKPVAARERASALGVADGEDPIEFLSSVLSAVPAVITRIDRQHRLRYANCVPPEVFAQIAGKSVFDIILPRWHDAARSCFEHVMETGAPGSYESEAQNNDGVIGTYINYVSRVREQDGGYGLCVVGIDITEKRTRERALSKKEMQLRVAVDASRIGLWSWDVRTNEVEWNDNMRQITGAPEPVALDRYVNEVVHPDDRDRVRTTGSISQTTGSFVDSAHRIVRPDGVVRWVYTTGRGELDDDGNLLVIRGGTLDITAQKETEERLRRSQKMEAVGSLTAGVAHNFNNMLMVLLPSLDLLKETASAQQVHVLDDAIATAARASDMVAQLMKFAGQRKARVLVPTRLATVVAESVRICERSFEQHITVATELDCAGAIDCDAADMSQVLMNIMLNARDSLVHAKTPQPRIDVHVSVVDDHSVCVMIQDNGPGMPPDVRGRALEPFFTTKDGRGTGLGLATCHTIVREHNGEIEISSQPGEGCTVTLRFPVSASTPATAKSTADDCLTAARRVLVVDDEDIVRVTVERVLARDKHEVVAVADAEQARAVLKEDTQFDVVLLDRSLRGTHGSTLLGELRAQLPKARILYFTGDFVEGTDAAEVDGVLQKPVGAPELRRAVTGY